MTTPKGNLLLESLLSLYADDLEICRMFKEVDMSQLNRKFYDELFLAIDESEFREVEALLRSDRVINYLDAINKATYACTRDLGNLIDFLLAGNENLKRLN